MLHRVREKLKEIGDDSMDYQEHPQPHQDNKQQ